MLVIGNKVGEITGLAVGDVGASVGLVVGGVVGWAVSLQSIPVNPWLHEQV